MAAREGRVLWEPPEELLRDSKMARYMRDRGFDSYDELWRWSVDDLEGFWRSIWDLYEVGPSPERVLGSSEMPGADWFPGTSRARSPSCPGTSWATRWRAAPPACAGSEWAAATGWSPTCRTWPRR